MVARNKINRAVQQKSLLNPEGVDPEDLDIASKWFVVQQILEHQGDKGLTPSEILALLERKVKEEGYNPFIVYRVAFNGMFEYSLDLLVNLNVLEVSYPHEGYPDLRTYRVTKAGERLLSQKYKDYIDRYVIKSRE